MIKINPLTGLPEETNDLVDPTNPDAQAAAMLPPAVDMSGGGGRYVNAVAQKAANSAEARVNDGAAPVFNIGGGKVDSTTQSTSTERQIVSPRVQAAAESVQKQVEEAQAANTNLQLAEQQKNEAETRVLQATKDAAKEAAEATARQARADLAGRAEAAKELQRKDAEADARIAAAGKQVETDYAATQRGYWKDKPWYYEALAGIAMAASRRNLRTMGEDPNKSGVVASINKKIEDDKALKFNKYIKSKEFLEDAKKLPGKAREAYNLKLADLQAESAAQLKLVAAEAERLKASADADPEAVATFQQQLLAKSQEETAMAKLKLQKEGLEAAQVANPNAKASSSTTRVDVDESTAGKPAPLASPADIERHSGLVKDAQSLRALADKIETSPESWANLQTAERRQAREGVISGFSLPIVGNVGKLATGIGQSIDSAVGIGGPTVEQKLFNTGDKAGAQISGDLNEYVVKSAKALDPSSVLRQEEISQRREMLGIQSSTAKEMAARIRKEAAEMEKKARSIEQVRQVPRP